MEQDTDHQYKYAVGTAAAPQLVVGSFSSYRLPLMMCGHNVLQQCLRSFCTATDSQCSSTCWVYAVFWRILPRNFPPPKWDAGGYPDRTKANKRNWILVWEDGYCDFGRATNSSVGLQPDLFFKMSHEVYNYGEGLMGKVAADNGHKWVHKDPSDHAENMPHSWQNTIDPQPRTWEPQFKSGIQTIAVIAVREGIVQLGSTHKIQEDHSFVTLLQRKFDDLLITLSNSSPVPARPRPLERNIVELQDALLEPRAITLSAQRNSERQMSCSNGSSSSLVVNPSILSRTANSCHCDIMHPASHIGPRPMITPSMSSLQALLSKLPAVTSSTGDHIDPSCCSSNGRTINYNGSLAFNHIAASTALSRSLSAPLEAFWLQDQPSNPSVTSTAPPKYYATVSDSHILKRHHSPPTCVSVDPNASATAVDYTFMGDLMSG